MSLPTDPYRRSHTGRIGALLVAIVLLLIFLYLGGLDRQAEQPPVHTPVSTMTP